MLLVAAADFTNALLLLLLLLPLSAGAEGQHPRVCAREAAQQQRNDWCRGRQRHTGNRVPQQR
jgi:hypothetical protein